MKYDVFVIIQKKDVLTNRTKFKTKNELRDAVNNYLTNGLNDDYSSYLKYGAMQLWDVSDITDFCYLFHFYESYSNYFYLDNLNNWNVSKVTDMSYMFLYSYYDVNISSWNISNVKSMEGMFAGCNIQNWYVSSWNVSNVEDMSYMFAGSSSTSNL